MTYGSKEPQGLDEARWVWIIQAVKVPEHNRHLRVPKPCKLSTHKTVNSITQRACMAISDVEDRHGYRKEGVAFAMLILRRRVKHNIRQLNMRLISKCRPKQVNQHTFVVTIVLPDGLSGSHLPQPSSMIRRRFHQSQRRPI